jgi:hypothetical protein
VGGLIFFEATFLAQTSEGMVPTLAGLQYWTGEVDYWLEGSARLLRTTAAGSVAAPNPLGVILWWRLSALAAAWATEQALASGSVDLSPSWRALARCLRASGESLENLVPQVGSPRGHYALDVALRAARVVVPGLLGSSARGRAYAWRAAG